MRNICVDKREEQKRQSKVCLLYMRERERERLQVCSSDPTDLSHGCDREMTLEHDDVSYRGVEVKHNQRAYRERIRHHTQTHSATNTHRGEGGMISIDRKEHA